MVKYGYKAFKKGLIARNGKQLELKKAYLEEGTIKWGENGFHACSNLSDCFRYYEYNDDTEIAYIMGFGNIEIYNDDYYGYYDMFVSEGIYVIKVLSREEIIEELKKITYLNEYQKYTLPDYEIIRKKID